MAIKDIEIKSPDVVTRELGEAVFNQMFGEERNSQQGEADQQANESHIDSAKQEQIDDIPNASIRLDKMRKQRDEERQAKASLEKMVSELQGKLSVLERDNEYQVKDPTEDMSDFEKSMYNENQQLKESLNKLTEIVSKMQQDDSMKRLEDQENKFFERNPELKEKKDQFIDDILDYLGNKPTIKKMLSSGQLSLDEVYGMYSASKPRPKKRADVNNPDKVFSGSAQAAPVGKTSESEDGVAFRKALQILGDKNSENKSQAANFLNQKITSDIISSLEI